MQIIKKQKLLILIFLLLIISLLIFGILGNRSFQKHTKYNIAKVISDYHYRNTRGGSGYDYSFILNGKLYNRTESNGNFIKGNYYLVAYDSTSPKSTQLLEINITDSEGIKFVGGESLELIKGEVKTIEILSCSGFLL